MVNLRFVTILLLGILLSSAVLAHNDATTTNNNGLDNQNMKEGLVDETEIVAAEAESKRLRGRKMGTEKVAKEVEVGSSEVKKGKDINSKSMSYGTSNLKDSTNSADHTANLGAQQSYQTMSTEKLVEANAEIFKMMSKDYHQNPHRRPPINNNFPLKDRKNDVNP